LTCYLQTTPRTLELFVESLLNKAMQVTMQRNAKTLSPSHIKQCILAESRFDFLRDLVKNIPDVTAAEEKEMQSGESSPNSRFSDVSSQQRVVRQDSNSSSSSDVKIQQCVPLNKVRCLSVDADAKPKIETVTSQAIDLTVIKNDKPIIPANFYQETLPDEMSHTSVIAVNPIFASPQPSTSSLAEDLPRLTSEAIDHILRDYPKPEPLFEIDLSTTPLTPVVKSLKPEIKILDSGVANTVGVKVDRKVRRRNSNSKVKKIEKPVMTQATQTTFTCVHLQLDEDYDT
ncbi:dr1-associated corepressor, partial [Leptidea sinapis]|uniref:dr1-associated corepressor n=1 Tax=Leptidea sinapis TaxID=189913 RepID=UPI0021C3F262